MLRRSKLCLNAFPICVKSIAFKFFNVLINVGKLSFHPTLIACGPSSHVARKYRSFLLCGSRERTFNDEYYEMFTTYFDKMFNCRFGNIQQCCSCTSFLVHGRTRVQQEQDVHFCVVD